MSNNFNFTESGYVPGPPYDFDFSPPAPSYSILKGLTNDFSAIWADTDAGLSVGKMYIGLEGYFNVVNLSNQTIYDWYSAAHKGRGNETLTGSGIVDINVTQGV
jgi:hypothetical protein